MNILDTSGMDKEALEKLQTIIDSVIDYQKKSAFYDKFKELRTTNHSYSADKQKAYESVFDALDLF